MKQTRSAFALTDLAALLVVAGTLLALMALATERTRRNAMVGEDLSHLRQIGQGTASFGGDHADRIWGFSWQSGMIFPTPYADLQALNHNDMVAGAAQATHLVRTRGGRTMAETPVPSNWIAHAAYSHMVLLDYLDLPLPSRLFVSAADERWKWANDPRGYDQGLYTPHLGIGSTGWRHPYASSFRIGLGYYDEAPLGSRISPQSTSLYIVPAPQVLRQKLLTSVRHPSQKALVHDIVARHFGKPVWHMTLESRTPVLMVDGSAAVRAFAEANRGANPNNPTALAPVIGYQPSPIEPGPSGILVPMGTLWTRMDIRGRDFGGLDVYP